MVIEHYIEICYEYHLFILPAIFLMLFFCFTLLAMRMSPYAHSSLIIYVYAAATYARAMLDTFAIIYSHMLIFDVHILLTFII